MPHSDIHGSKPVCGSPWLFAAYHVLLRPFAPRHPPYALSNLTYCALITTARGSMFEVRSSIIVGIGSANSFNTHPSTLAFLTPSTFQFLANCSPTLCSFQRTTSRGSKFGIRGSSIVGVGYANSSNKSNCEFRTSGRTSKVFAI